MKLTQFHNYRDVVTVERRQEACRSICKAFYLQEMCLEQAGAQTNANRYDMDKTMSIPGTGEGKQTKTVIQWTRQEDKTANHTKAQASSKQYPKGKTREVIQGEQESRAV